MGVRSGLGFAGHVVVGRRKGRGGEGRGGEGRGGGKVWRRVEGEGEEVAEMLIPFLAIVCLASACSYTYMEIEGRLFLKTHSLPLPSFNHSQL